MVVEHRAALFTECAASGSIAVTLDVGQRAHVAAKFCDEFNFGYFL
jgi:hypothetical protein